MTTITPTPIQAAEAEHAAALAAHWALMAARDAAIAAELESRERVGKAAEALHAARRAQS